MHRVGDTIEVARRHPGSSRAAAEILETAAYFVPPAITAPTKKMRPP